MALFSERRQSVRVGVNGKLSIESVSVGQPLRLVDVGTAGFCVRSLAALPLDVVASYRFATPDRKWSAIFEARAVYCRPETGAGQAFPCYLSGLTFLYTESPSVQRRLLVMMDHAMGFVSFS